MIYLIASFVAGIILLISGKVKFGKTLYLEGTKARIAGLIFLVPVGLAILIIIAVLFMNLSETLLILRYMSRA